MNFFAQQERARAHTKRMLVLFVLAVACIVAALDFVLFLAFGSSGHGVHPGIGAVMFWNSVLVIGIIGACSMYKITALRGGGGVVARQLGATFVEPTTTDFAHKRLRNVVEEIAIASGVPVPEVYVLEGESAINAFAAGYTPADAAVTVTQGCLDKLNREELQGVIAHEFSHVLNGDMRLNIRLMGVLFGILVIGIIGRKIAANSGRSRDSGYAVLIGIAILAIGYIGVFFGRLIKAGISRQREYLADASAVQFTRQTTGIAGALKKIGGLADGSKLASGETEEVAHMLFGDGVGYSALFATHPPLHLRIKAIDPAFDPVELDAIAKAWSNPVPVGESDGAQVSISGFAPAPIASALATAAPVAPAAEAVLPQADAQIALSAQKVVKQVAHPGNDDYQTAGAIHGTISDKLRALAYMGTRCQQVVFALAVDTDATMRGKQLALLEKRYDANVRKGVEEILVDTDTLHPMQRLPLAQLAFPALRRQPRPQLQTFLVALNELIQADGEVHLEEYCLAKLVGVQVMDALDPSKARPTGSTKLTTCASEVADAISIVAEYGSDSEADAERAYLVGMNEVLPDDIAPYLQREEWIVALDRALPLLDALAPAGKELLVRGFTAAIGADGKVSVTEAELLRTICAALHCPLPPQLDRAA
ncbi:MAG: peptidase M48 Ste24p [Xanthomonadales bacterium PRO7]|jgi:Zn-dependent protease with chaperone function|nr:peptidase M48 Ste24p [Xanthomonadales bacterium PRO7]